MNIFSFARMRKVKSKLKYNYGAWLVVKGSDITTASRHQELKFYYLLPDGIYWGNADVCIIYFHFFLNGKNLIKRISIVLDKI